ncbi:antigen-presenting glycoprotein CD1d-like isoform X3 [Alexandromys fortis]|uniref:antigen-presenting glycoprotein CD1d-like isoform X3 n=1 Tax=Alexandromys fortis TaxID=100897 RepID=UPI0021528DC7|nr:antigen-presenting glycoprotein CD1d-like isoform X3 [Microtus fortis]
MWSLPCLLFWVFPWLWVQSEAQQNNFPFRILQISSFPNSSRSSTDSLAWLGDLQTHRWSNASDTIDFVKPWSQGKFSDQQWEHLQRIFQVYRFSFTRDIQEFVKMLPNIHYPVEIQMSTGCDVYSENASESFFYVAFQGEYILSFQGTSFQKAPDAPPWTELVIKVLNGDQGTMETLQWLLNDICPKFVHGLLEAGKAELEKQEKPEVWLSSGLSPKHGHLQLLCHVSGFYPKPVWVMWMHGEQKQNSTQTTEYLSNADETWYLQATLDVEAGKESGLACCVKHSSLGEQDIICHSQDDKNSPINIIIVVVLLVVGLICVLICSYVIYTKKRCSYQGIPGRAVVEHAFNPSTREAEAGGSL